MGTKPPREKNMSNKGQLLQDPFLNLLRKEHVPVSIYLVNGIKLQGHIESFDQYVVLLRNTVTQMVYKHAISTVVPGRAVNFHPGEATECASPRRPAGGAAPPAECPADQDTCVEASRTVQASPRSGARGVGSGAACRSRRRRFRSRRVVRSHPRRAGPPGPVGGRRSGRARGR